MHKKIENMYKERIFIFSVIILFFLLCAFIKSFWEMIFILTIVFFSTIYAYIKTITSIKSKKSKLICINCYKSNL